MGHSPFAAAVEALRRPLEFSASDNFVRMGRVQNLSEHVRQCVHHASNLAIPSEVSRIIRSLELRFSDHIDKNAIDQILAVTKPFASRDFEDKALARSVASLPGVGQKRAGLLESRGLGRVVDLLFHLPVDYDDRRELATIDTLEVGRRVTFVAEVLRAKEGRQRGRWRTFSVIVGDEKGKVTLKWFRGFDMLRRSLHKGVSLRVTGEVKRYRFDKELIHPEVEIIGEASVGTDPVVAPDYSTVAGIPPRTLRGAVKGAVESYSDFCPGFLPTELVDELDLPNVADALRRIHTPGPEADLVGLRDRSDPAHQRLILEELYLLEIGLALKRATYRRDPGIRIPTIGPRLRAARQALPFTLTSAQERVWSEISADLESGYPMNRLLQGDVGSGKTVVAYLAALANAEAGCQTALMAPTELLAEQHGRTLDRLSRASPQTRLEVALFTASRGRVELETVRTRVGRGEVECVVGTQALLQPAIAFHRLALVVIDEQHRFGVRQRAALAEKMAGTEMPHNLVMTATPIPRTLSLTLYGDLDLSVIDTLPPGRQPVETILLRAGEGKRIMELLNSTLGRGEQSYVVYPLIEESDAIALRAAVDQVDAIRAALPDYRVELIHGRLAPVERQRIMEDFEEGDIGVLVATTVIEVGVDVPGATLMIIENAERFGLAQLHQLRGRVGRGGGAGTCVLVARGTTRESEARLRTMLETTDGFQIADADLKIRGPGEFLGTRQHGRLPDLRIADLLRDSKLLVRARTAAFEVVERDPTLRLDPVLARAVELRWGDRLSLSAVG